MAGLPSENDDDIEATASLLLALKKATPGLRLSLGVSSLCPKPTPRSNGRGAA